MRLPPVGYMGTRTITFGVILGTVKDIPGATVPNAR